MYFVRSHHGMPDMFGRKDALPRVLPPLGTKSLASYLATDLPKSNLTENLQINLASYRMMIGKALDAGELQKDDVVCLALDRAEGRVFKQSWFQ